MFNFPVFFPINILKNKYIWSLKHFWWLKSFAKYNITHHINIKRLKIRVKNTTAITIPLKQDTALIYKKVRQF